MALSLPRRPRGSHGLDSSNPFSDPLDHNEFNSDVREIRPGESASVVNGIEVTSTAGSRSASRRDGMNRGDSVMRRGDDGALRRHGSGTNNRDSGALQVKDRVWEEIANKLLPPEESALMIQRLEKTSDKRQRRTYVAGVPSAETQENAPVLSVGLTFLAGADKPQVNRSEQSDMAGGEPDQKDATWRLNTAGSLLLYLDVTPDLQVVHTDQTAAALKRHQERVHRSGSMINQMTSSTKALLGKQYAAVNIDSDYVSIVNELQAGEWDLESTLIEIDGSSLNGLICNYRHLISRGGPDMTFQDTKLLLETMIEDARRVCVRSPILFRMSTRQKIINSKNTCYGIDHGTMFRTLNTSKGIREIIAQTAAYYNSLDPAGSRDETQKFIRPKFLQMLVLLLSFLNNDDLREIKDFLESTYKIKAERPDLEILILKVIPLISINSKVFLKSLIPAIEGYPLTPECTEGPDFPDNCWDYFIQRLLQLGYIVPGTVLDLGRSEKSWVVMWPEDGIKSTIIFNDLQYAGCRLRTINEIPPLELHPETALEELTVFLTNGQTYIIGSRDLEPITCLQSGTYSVIETKQNGKIFDLDIQEYEINIELIEAIRRTNDIIRQFNLAVTSPPRGKSLALSFNRPKIKDFGMLNDIKASGRLTRNTAVLNQDWLAMAFKIEGRKITRNDLVRIMDRDIRELRQVIYHLETRAGFMADRMFGSVKAELRQSLNEVKNLVAIAENNKRGVGGEIEITDEPISKVVYPGNADRRDAYLWNDYETWFTNACFFHIEAKQSVVSHVSWLSEQLIEVALEHVPSKFIVAPLQLVEEGVRNDEVQEGDIAVLAGHYMIIAVPNESPNPQHREYIMTNYLRVQSAEEQNVTRRGANRTKRAETRTQCVFR